MLLLGWFGCQHPKGSEKKADAFNLKMGVKMLRGIEVKFQMDSFLRGM